MSSLLNATVATGPTAGTLAPHSQLFLSTTDYVVFTSMLGISAAIGVYFGFFAKGADTTEEYLMGGKRLRMVPIAISLVASQLSAISIMSIPAEMYAYGINWMFTVVSMVLVVPLLNYVVIPVFYNNHITNCYEYLELRFCREMRVMQTFIFIISTFFMLPIIIFLPSLAFAQVTGYNVHVINVVVSSICIFYTMFGGIKAVVWTDVIQAAIMVMSVVLVGVLGAYRVGGLSEVLRIAGEGGRLDINYNFDLSTRSTIWNVFTSATLTWSGFTGIVIYSRFQDCDPIQAGQVSKLDKIVPYFVQDTVGHLRGMPGVFISCVFSAALSTLSAGINSLGGVVYFDYIKPYIKHTEHRANVIMKLFVLFTGVYCVFGGLVVQNFNSILQVIYSIGGISFGSTCGAFLLGMLVPKSHGRAAVTGVLASIVCMATIVILSWGRNHYDPLPMSSASCPAPPSNATIGTGATLFHGSKDPVGEEGFSILDLSFNWYMVAGFVITWLVALPLSYILKPRSDFKLDPKLLSPVVRHFAIFKPTPAAEPHQLKLETCQTV
ncbi:sodium-coupled monocarboxylate transporter 2 isoform X2 [Drosophila biarmipes]|uniref:sodium-coupled monocarboxylate transporter 2 isoform X2 n=1 Tax=Drosophila biarmipes TaxID=125945 RepID=UPI0007E6D9C9|nr:sodium-coupled monocarboxylate transporter 2 isoform X2 [Drosophila biarmipes]